VARVGRHGENIWVSGLGLLLTLGIAFAMVVILIVLSSDEPGRALLAFFLGPFTNSYFFANMLNAAVPLVFTGLGMALAFQGSVFNLGGEGQVYSGGLIATVICLALPAWPGLAGAALALAGAVAAGAVLAGFSGLFRMKYGSDELISSFLISAAVILVVHYFITGPLDDPENNLLATRAIGAQYHLKRIFLPSRLNSSVFAALAAAGLAAFLLYATRSGYELRMCGLNREFARYGGIDVRLYLLLPMLLSGALHGLAGGLSILGTYQRCIKGFSAGMGWNGIAVALIARNHPLGVLPAALFFAYLEAGARAAMLQADVTFELAAIAQATIFYLITAQALTRYLSLGGRPGA
jgi:ABC-type uncharacterized transport system permease subunit